MPPRKPMRKGRLRRWIVQSAAIATIGTLATGCPSKAKKQQFIMRDLNQPGNQGKVFNYVPREFQHRGKFALDGSSPKGTGARKLKQRPKLKQATSKGK